MRPTPQWRKFNSKARTSVVTLQTRPCPGLDASFSIRYVFSCEKYIHDQGSAAEPCRNGADCRTGQSCHHYAASKAGGVCDESATVDRTAGDDGDSGRSESDAIDPRRRSRARQRL